MMSDKSLKPNIIKSVTAIVCCAAIALSGSSVIDKITKNKQDIATANASQGETWMEDSFEEFESDVQNSIAASAGVSDNGTTSGNSEQGGSDTSTDANGNAASTQEKKQISLNAGLTSNNVEEVLEYYKLVSKRNANLKFTKTLTLVSMSGGKSISQKAVDFFQPIAEKALAKNTITDEPYPGKPEKIVPSDWVAAAAKNDGKYTTVMIKVKEQTDGVNGSQFEGCAGRSMGVLDGIQLALSEMSVVSIDFAKTKMEVRYQNPMIKLKVKNSTGELVKGCCEWGYRTQPYIYYLDGKVTVFNIHLEDASGVVDYSVKY